jgi:hypothetical protein
MLEEAPDYRSHPDGLAVAGHAGPKATEATHDQIDGDAGPGCFAECGDHRRILELVHLGDDPGRAAGAVVFGLSRD